MNKSPLTLLSWLLFIALVIPFSVQAQKKKKNKKQVKIEVKAEKKAPLDKVSLSGLKFRNIGPAITSGRVADIAVNPTNPSEYYVATASGGVCKV